MSGTDERQWLLAVHGAKPEGNPLVELGSFARVQYERGFGEPKGIPITRKWHGTPRRKRRKPLDQR